MAIQLSFPPPQVFLGFQTKAGGGGQLGARVNVICNKLICIEIHVQLLIKVRLCRSTKAFVQEEAFEVFFFFSDNLGILCD